MSKRFKHIVIVGLTGAFIVSSIFCCCLTDHAQAKEETPPCHQTTSNSNASGDHSTQDHTDCDCPKIISTSSLKIAGDFSLVKTGLLEFEHFSTQHSFIPAFVVAYQAPPDIFKSTIPLYLQNSVLRI